MRAYAEQIEREQRVPPELVAERHAAGFYRMVMPRSLGGLQVDPVTDTGVVETLAVKGVTQDHAPVEGELAIDLQVNPEKPANVLGLMKDHAAR